MKFKKSILILLLVALSFITINANNLGDASDNTQSLTHNLNAFRSEVEVGNTLNYELTLSNSYNELAEASTLTVNLPVEVSTGELQFLKDVSELSLYGVVPVLQGTTLVYHFDTLDQAFTESIIISLGSYNGAALNLRQVNVSSQLVQGDYIEDEFASSVLLSSWNLNVTNEFMGVKEDENAALEPSEALVIDQYAVFGLGLSSNKLEYGTLALSDQAQVLVSLHLAKGARYHTDTSGITPTLTDAADGQLVEWTLNASDYEDLSNYLSASFQVTIVASDASEPLENYSKYKTNLTVSTTFADQNVYAAAAETTTTAVLADGTLPPPTSGSRLLPGLHGPIDGNGNVGGRGVQNDVTVTDAATLGWQLSPTSQSATHSYTALHSYDVFFILDTALVIDSFYSGDYSFRPTSNLTETPLGAPVYMSIRVLYEGDQDWTQLKDTLYESTLYTAEELGIDTSREVSAVWLAYHTNGAQDIKFPTSIGNTDDTVYERGKIQAGLMSRNLKFTTSIRPGHTGDVTGKFAQAVSGYNHQNTKVDHYTPFLEQLLSDGFVQKDARMVESPNIGGYIPQMTAKVVEAPVGDSRVIQARVDFTEVSNSTVDHGENKLEIIVKSDETSLRSIKGPFTLKVLLPEGVKYDDQKELKYATLVDLVSNYEDSNRELLTLQYKGVGSLAAGSSARLLLPVIISDKAPYLLETDVVGYLDEEFIVSDSPNDIGYLTQRIKDPFAAISEAKEVYYINNASTYRFAYQYYLLATVYDQELSSYQQNAKITDFNDIQSRLTIVNNKTTPLKELELVYTLPKIGDTYITKHNERHSTVDLVLQEAIDTSAYGSKLEVFYTYSEDVHDTSAEWIIDDDVTDYALVTAFKIVKNAGTSSIQDSELHFDLMLKAEGLEQRALTSLTQQSVQTFTAQLDDNTIIESAPSYMNFKDKEEEVVPPIEEVVPPKEEVDDNTQEEKTPSTGLRLNGIEYMLVMILSLLYVIMPKRKRNVR